MGSRLFGPTASIARRRAVDTQDFVAVVLVGRGESLYPFNEGTNVSSKALMPVGNVSVINLVLDWIIESGLTDILLIVPPEFHSAISDHLTENYSGVTHPRVRIDVKRYTDGEKDEDESEGGFGGSKEQTARLLRRFRAAIKSDFVLLPCDLAPPPGFTLTSVLDKHRATPEAVLTSVFYEPVESVREDAEKILVAMDKSTDELLLVEPLESMEEEFDMRTALLASHPSLSLSTRLLDAHIYVFRRTILDLLATRRPRDLASMREQFVPWLIKGAWQQGLSKRWSLILDPPKKDVFAEALARSTTARPSIVPYLQDYLASPSTPQTSLPTTTPASPRSGAGGLHQSIGDLSHVASPEPKLKRGEWKCQLVIVKPEPVEAPPAPTSGKNKDKAKAAPPAEPSYLIRANSLAGYWELNRRFLRNMAASGTSGIPPAPRTANVPLPTSATTSTGTATGNAGDEAVPIAPTAQISPDSLIGEGTKVGERASIKKCAVGRHCNIGRGAKITGCVLWDFVTVEENARIENAILCSNVRIGEKASIKDCEFGPGFEALPGATLKGERLVAGQEA